MYAYKPNFRTLGQRGLGKQAQELKKAWAKLVRQRTQVARRHRCDGKGSFNGVDLVREDIEAAFETKPGFAAAGDRVGVVILETTLDDELRDLGLFRELLNRVQAARKELELEYTDRIRIGITGSERVKGIVDRHGDELAQETLAVSVSSREHPPGADRKEMDVEGEVVTIAVAKA